MMTNLLRRWLWLIAICAVLAGGIAYYVTAHIALEYAATATLLVKPATDSPANYYSSLLAGERLALTYSQMIKGQAVIEKTIDNLRLPMTPDELAGKVSVEPVRDTQLIHVTVTDPTPARAAQIANALADLFAAQPHDTDMQPDKQASAMLQAQRDELGKKIDQAEAQIDELTGQVTEVQATRSRLEGQLVTARDNYRLQYQGYTDLVSTSALNTDGIRVFPPGQTSGLAQGPPYTATAMVIVEPVISKAQNGGSELTPQQQALAYVQLINVSDLLDAASGSGSTAAPTGSGQHAAATAQSVTAGEPTLTLEVVPNLSAIQINVTDQSAWRAPVLADRAAAILAEQVKSFVAAPFEKRLATIKADVRSLADQVDSLQAQLIDLDRLVGNNTAAIARANRQVAEYQAQDQVLQQEAAQLRQRMLGVTDIVTVTEPAYAPNRPVRSPLTYALLAALAGALIAATVALAGEYISRTALKIMPSEPAQPDAATAIGRTITQ